MSGRVTFKRRPHTLSRPTASALSVQQLSARYGDEVADLAHSYADLIRERFERPTSQDMKRTLQAFAKDPAPASLRRLDGYTEALLFTEALKHHREQLMLYGGLAGLSGEALARCAIAALQRPFRSAGRPKTDDLAVSLVKKLLQHPLALTPAGRRQLVADVPLKRGRDGKLGVASDGGGGGVTNNITVAAGVQRNEMLTALQMAMNALRGEFRQAMRTAGVT